jgi:hypothetical protein
LFKPEGTKIDPRIIYRDGDNNRYTPGKCQCSCDLCEAILNPAIEALSQLDHIICAVMVSAFTTIAEVGLEFVPGGQVSAAVRAAVLGAKLFTENGLDAALFFGDWVGDACGVKDWSFDLMSVFGPLADAPDSMGISVGCKKKKSACKKMFSKTDPTTKEIKKTTSTKKKTPTTTTKMTKNTQPAKTTGSKKITTAKESSFKMNTDPATTGNIVPTTSKKTGTATTKKRVTTTKKTSSTASKKTDTATNKKINATTTRKPNPTTTKKP